jgi:hypothetical protein
MGVSEVECRSNDAAPFPVLTGELVSTEIPPFNSTPTFSSAPIRSAPLKAQVVAMEVQLLALQSWAAEMFRCHEQDMVRSAALEAMIQQLQGKVSSLEVSQQQMQAGLAALEISWTQQLQAASPSYSLILRNLPEVQGGDLLEQVAALRPFAGSMGDVLSVRRHGAASSAKARIVVVVFSSFAAKMRVKRLSWKLAGSILRLDHFLSGEQLHKRLMQWGRIAEARRMHMQWAWSEGDPTWLVVGPRRRN